MPLCERFKFLSRAPGMTAAMLRDLPRLKSPALSKRVRGD
jgi:hypothetical protein